MLFEIEENQLKVSETMLKFATDREICTLKEICRSVSRRVRSSETIKEGGAA